MKKLVITTMVFLSLGVASLGTKAHADETNQVNTMPTSSLLEQTQATTSTRIDDGVYHPYWQSFDDKFNVGFDIVVANNEIIDAYNPWHDLTGMTVLFEDLKIVSPKEAIYYLQVQEGFQIVHQYLHAKINPAGVLEVFLTHS